MKNVKVYFIRLMKDLSFPKSPYLIQFEKLEPFYIELPYDYISPNDETAILRREINRIFGSIIGPNVNYQLIRSKVTEQE